MRASNIMIVCYSIGLFMGCQNNFQNIGDPSSIAGLLYSVNLSSILGESGEPQIIVSETPSYVREGSSVLLGIRLSNGTKETKQLKVSSDTSSVTINGQSSITLNFDTTNSTTEQTITIKAEEDENLISETSHITIESDWQPSIQFEIISIDNDIQSIFVTRDVSTLSEGDDTQVKINLAQEPSEDINVTISSSNSQLLNSNISQMVFNSKDYYTPKPITISALNHELYIFDQIGKVGFHSNGIESVNQDFTLKNNNLEFLDITVGGIGTSHTGWYPSTAIDTINSKLLIATTNQDNDSKLSLFRCNLDGTNCIHTDISAGLDPVIVGSGSGWYTSIAIDPNSSNPKILVATTNYSNNKKLSLFRCDLDGSNCTHTDISSSVVPIQSTRSGERPSLTVDVTSSKLLISTTNYANNKQLSLFRCDLDGSNCSHTDVSSTATPSQGIGSGLYSKILLDSINSKLYIATTNDSNNKKPALYICNSDATNCNYYDISDGQGSNSGYYPSIAIDKVSSKILVATQNDANSGKLGLFRCSLDGLGCKYTDISAGQGVDSGQYSSMLTDPINSKIYVVTTNFENGKRLGLFRCELDGTNCKYYDISAGKGDKSGWYPSMVFDDVNSKVLVVTKNDETKRIGFYRFPLNFLD
ncbi:MAG: hypothetical protein H7A23_06560 [Leptospiraceae bacterium]|nr:hypothetical protein [Leptospiraceae bacterium]MCP5494201.1 hypothetical protein [Leptospiraceae bacterium]